MSASGTIFCRSSAGGMTEVTRLKKPFDDFDVDGTFSPPSAVVEVDSDMYEITRLLLPIFPTEGVDQKRLVGVARVERWTRGSGCVDRGAKAVDDSDDSRSTQPTTQRTRKCRVRIIVCCALKWNNRE